MSGSRGGWSSKGLFVNGVWHCDCNPREPATHRETKTGRNKGKWFRGCPKWPNSPQCGFFLWDSDAHDYEVAALANNSRSEPVPNCNQTIPNANPNTTPKRQPSPPPPYTIQSGSSELGRKRTRSSSDSRDDEYGFGQADDAFHDELDQIMTQTDPPSKAVKTTLFATPATARRFLPWQMDQPTTASAYGLPTPHTDRRTSVDPFASQQPTKGASLFTPSRVAKDETTPPSSFETPTPSRSKLIAADDLVHDVFDLLHDNNVRIGPHGEKELKTLLMKHAQTARNLKMVQDIRQKTINAREKKIAYLEAELEVEKETVKCLQGRIEDESSDT